MITLLFIMTLVLTVACIGKSVKHYKREGEMTDTAFVWGVTAFCVGAIATGFGIAALILLGQVIDIGAVDDRIAIYEEHNTNINNALAQMVENYMEYESKTFEKAKLQNIDVAIAIQAYPDLQAQPLVQQQIDTYMNNQSEVIRLKEQKVARKTVLWWLCFGILKQDEGY